MTPWTDSGTGGFEFDASCGRVTKLTVDGDTNLLFEGTVIDGVQSGDRCWLAPELAHFYERANDPGSAWRCPTDLDPGTWVGDGFQATQSFRNAEMQRTVQAVISLPFETSMPWSGYVVEDSVRTDEMWSVWHLLPVRMPAHIYVGAARDITEYYPPAPSLIDGWLSPTAERWKIGLQAPADGRTIMAAAGEADTDYLVVILTRTDPSGTYADTPPSGGIACPIQVFSDQGIPCGELEHHAPLETKQQRAVVIGTYGSLHDRKTFLAKLEHSFDELVPTALA